MQAERNRPHGAGQSSTLSEVAHHVVDGLGDVLDVLRGDAGHGDAAIVQHVHVVLLDHLRALLRAETGEGEHACAGRR